MEKRNVPFMKKSNANMQKRKAPVQEGTSLKDVFGKHEANKGLEYTDQEKDLIFKTDWEEFADSEGSQNEKELPEEVLRKEKERYRNDISGVSKTWENANSKMLGGDIRNIKKGEFPYHHSHLYLVPPIQKYEDKIRNATKPELQRSKIRGGLLSIDQISYLQRLGLDRYNSIVRIVTSVIDNPAKSIKKIENAIYLKANYAVTSCYLIQATDLASVWISFCFDGDNKAAYVAYRVHIEDRNDSTVPLKMRQLVGVYTQGDDIKKVKDIQKLEGKVEEFFIYFCDCNPCLSSH